VLADRVSGRLAVTRAFGDYEIKFQMQPDGRMLYREFLSVIPEIRKIELDYEDDEFILLASDGLFDKLSSQECVDFVHKEMKNLEPTDINLRHVASLLADQVIYVKRVLDNVTIMIVGLNRKKR